MKTIEIQNFVSNTEVQQCY